MNLKLIRVDQQYGPVIRSHLVLHVVKNCHRVENTIHTKGAQWQATVEIPKIYLAINRSSAKIDRQIAKHKENPLIIIKKMVN